MKKVTTLIGLFAAWSLLCVWPANAAEPTGAIDLSCWKLTLPIDANGKLGGHAAEVSARRLAADDSHPDHSNIRPDGTITSWSPVTGATTDDSDDPRSVLLHH